MTPRENFLRALRRDNPEFVPWHISLGTQHQAQLKNVYGSEDEAAYFGLCHRLINLNPTIRTGAYDHYYKELPEGAFIDPDWGIAYVPGSHEAFSRALHPMERFETVEEILSFPLPDYLEDYRWEGFNERVKAVQDAGFAAVFTAVQIYEPAWALRGMDNLLMDMAEGDEKAAACMERITAMQEKVSRRLAESGLDMIIFGDDVGMQNSMIMSADIWRETIKPATARTIAAAKAVNPDILAYYHSDGYIEPIIPELIEIGVDVLNPIQPECMDPVKIKAEYGSSLSFWGTVGTQTTMPFGTADEVRECVKRMIETVGQGGGFVVAPTHYIEPEVPWENVFAFVEAAREYGKY